MSGVEIRCEEKGSCPPGCHLCHHQTTVGGASGRGHASGGGGGNSRRGEQPSPTPVLLEVSRVVPLYSLVQENVTKEVRKMGEGPFSVCEQRSKESQFPTWAVCCVCQGRAALTVEPFGFFILTIPAVMVLVMPLMPIVQTMQFPQVAFGCQ